MFRTLSWGFLRGQFSGCLQSVLEQESCRMLKTPLLNCRWGHPILWQRLRYGDALLSELSRLKAVACALDAVEVLMENRYYSQQQFLLVMDQRGAPRRGKASLKWACRLVTSKTLTNHQKHSKPLTNHQKHSKRNQKQSKTLTNHQKHSKSSKALKNNQNHSKNTQKHSKTLKNTQKHSKIIKK